MRGESRDWRHAAARRRNTLLFVSGPRRCKSYALTPRVPEKWLFDALCHQILALQICDRALYGSVVELPGFVGIEEATAVHSDRIGEGAIFLQEDFSLLPLGWPSDLSLSSPTRYRHIRKSCVLSLSHRRLGFRLQVVLRIT
ncbi:hypothetical protein ISCGN_024187 [Ixodes scapularis]